MQLKKSFKNSMLAFEKDECPKQNKTKKKGFLKIGKLMKDMF